MFEKTKRRLMTATINNELPIELQLFLWNLIDELNTERDYLQCFSIKASEYFLKVTHSQLEYEEVYSLPNVFELSSNFDIFVIDDNENCTMMFSYEY